MVGTLNASESVSEALYELVLAAKQLRKAAINRFANVVADQQGTLGSLCEMQNGRAFPGDAYTIKGIRLLRPGNLGVSGYLSWTDSATTHLPSSFENEAQAFIVDEGDVVVNLTAQSLEDGFMGRVCFAREGDRSLLNQRIGRFRGFSKDVLPEFVFRMLQSSRFQEQAIRMCEGSKIKHLFWEHLAAFKIPLPSIADQHQVVSACRAIDNRLREAQKRQKHEILDRSKLFEQLMVRGFNAVMTFTEANTVEAFIRARLAGETGPTIVSPGLARQGGKVAGLGWHCVSAADVPRQPQEALVEPYVRETLIRLNPDITAHPSRVDDVLYRLRAIVMGVRSDGLVKANEEFAAWVLGERSMPFGPNGEHVTIRLIDFDDIEQNTFVITQQLTFRAGKTEKRADLVLIVNGLPLVVIEAKTPVRSCQSWLDGALKIHDDYERNVPELFVPNVFSVATEGKEYRYGSVRMPIDLWGPWRSDVDGLQSMGEVEKSVTAMLRPATVLDILANFTAFATEKGKRRIKIIARYQQVEGVNSIVERVVAGHPRKGLIWHFQGSGKSLLMLFAARKLRLYPTLKNPTVLVVVDRIDLDTQISGTFYAADMANLVRTDSRKELTDLLAKDSRKVIITTIHKFGEAEGVLNDRENIIVMVDEAHRTQEGDLGRKMREALPNAFLFGLTGTPINRADRNTFYAFGAEIDENGYMSRYEFSDSIRDGATKELHFEPRLVDLHIDQEAIEAAYAELTEGLTDEDKDKLGRAAAKMAILVKAPERISAICADIAKHFREKVAPNGVRRPGRYLRPRELHALRARTRQASAAGDVRGRDLGKQR